VLNSFCNRKKIGNTFEARPIMCVSFANEGKTQVGWIVVVGWRVQRWTSVNNTPPEESPCCVSDLDEMIMKSLCLEAFENYGGDGRV
jgi:hypothetical protein